MRNNELWYRNPWVWLLIAIPALTVLGSGITIYLAIAHPDALVSDTAREAPIARGRPADGAE